ncbi:hypothetical protein GIW67_21980 [Pseudomonas lactis]|jgi:hypothetical protein|nr:hypothetical protein [Pseudomonas lactis]MCF5020589.1 hypothetical protein [Pseudomonas lactis]
MGHKNFKEKGLAVVLTTGEKSPEGCIRPEDALMEISATDLLTSAPILPNDDSTNRQQALNADDEKLEALKGNVTNAPLEQPSGAQENPVSSSLQNPVNIVWRSLMLDP